MSKVRLYLGLATVSLLFRDFPLIFSGKDKAKNNQVGLLLQITLYLSKLEILIILVL